MVTRVVAAYSTTCPVAGRTRMPPAGAWLGVVVGDLGQSVRRRPGFAPVICGRAAGGSPEQQYCSDAVLGPHWEYRAPGCVRGVES